MDEAVAASSARAVRLGLNVTGRSEAGPHRAGHARQSTIMNMHRAVSAFSCCACSARIGLQARCRNPRREPWFANSWSRPTGRPMIVRFPKLSGCEMRLCPSHPPANLTSRSGLRKLVAIRCGDNADSPSSRRRCGVQVLPPSNRRGGAVDAGNAQADVKSSTRPNSPSIAVHAIRRCELVNTVRSAAFQVRGRRARPPGK